MSLTEEQMKRMEENRLRALEIKRRKQEEKEKKSTGSASLGGFFAATGHDSQQHSKKRKENDHDGEGKIQHCSPEEMRAQEIKNDNPSTHQSDGDDESLEDFERNASEYITQSEAQRMYCIPLGTLAVCSHATRDNPHRKGWSDMKLYLRSEVRRRAWKRFGGKEELKQERARRREKRLDRELEDMRDVFG
ncbi:hypothetical protein ACHAW6_006491 [Cyclotella cf. meneghiniana]